MLLPKQEGERLGLGEGQGEGNEEEEEEREPAADGDEEGRQLGMHAQDFEELI